MKKMTKKKKLFRKVTALAADYVYSGDFDWNFIRRSEGR